MAQKYCPLWTIALQTTTRQPCMGKDCGMYQLCYGKSGGRSLLETLEEPKEIPLKRVGNEIIH